MTGDFATADREIARLIEVAKGSNAHLWETAGHFLKGKLLVERGEFAQGLLVLRDAFETCDRTGWRISYEEYKGALALGFAGTGRLDEALVALDDAMAADRRARTGAGGMPLSCSASKAKFCSSKRPINSPWRPKIALTRRPKWPASRALYSGSCGSPSALPV